MDSNASVPRVHKILDTLKQKYHLYTTSGFTIYMHVALHKWGASWTIDLNAQTCSCCEWQISGIPCVHAISVILPRKEPWDM